MQQALGLALLIVPAALALVLLGEAVYAAFIAAGLYHFGSESMVGHGGLAYSSPLHYVGRALVWSVGLILAGALLRRSAVS